MALRDVWRALAGEPDQLHRLTVTGPPRVLPSRFAATTAGVAAVGASLLAATDGPVALDTRELAVALRSERYVLRGGRSVGTPFDPGPYLQRHGDLTLAAPPGTVDGRPLRWGAPLPAFGVARPEWR